MKKSLLIIALCVFISVSATAIAGNDKTNVSPIGDLNFADRVVNVLDHTSDPNGGNWITLGKYSDLRRIQLPSPMSLTYNGPKHIEYGGASGTLYKGENEIYTVSYPSSYSYRTHPVYLPGEKVKMSFHGERGLEGDVDIYLFNLTSDSAYGIFDALKAGEIGNLDSLFHSNMDGNYKKYTADLGGNGDLLNYDLGSFDAGQYCIVMIQENEDSSLTVLSATAFVVTEYELKISTPGYTGFIVKGKNLDISMDLKDASDEDECTYGAVLINEDAYKADVIINSDGTRSGSSLIINDIDIIDEFDINTSNYKSKLTKNELQEELQTLIGEGKGTIAVGEAGDSTLSLTTLDLSAGTYYVFVGAYIPGKGLVGLNQLETRISGKCCDNCDNCHGNCCDDCANCPDCDYIPDNKCCGNCDNCHGNCCNDCPNCPYCDYNHPDDECCDNCDGCHDGKCCDDCDDCENCNPTVDYVVGFIASPMSGKAPLCVQFTDKSTGSPTTWYWDFGDGTNSTEQNPIHIFTAAGTYTVKLTASYGNVNISKTATVTIIATKHSPSDLVADFIASPMSGKAPLCVQFTDKSTGSPTAWYWNFGDGASSTAQSPAHTFTAEGTYTVNLTASNENGTSPTPKTATITVKKEGGGGGGSGSGGSSGGSISPESSKNIKCKELCQQYISSGEFIKFEFKKGDTCINYVTFKAKKTAGKTTAIVEELKEKSSLTPEKPEGEICKYVNIWVGNSGFANSNNIENATVGFKVSKDWIDKNNINLDSLVLQHFNDKKWNHLPTKKIDEDKEYIYFESSTPSFSPFAISAEKNKVTIEGKDRENDVCSGDVAQDETKSTSDTTSQENKNQTILKITTFLAGLIIILIIGAIIMRKKKPEQ